MTSGSKMTTSAPHALLQYAAIAKPHLLSRQCGELADGILKRQRVFLAHVLAQDARKCAVGAGWDAPGLEDHRAL